MGRKKAQDKKEKKSIIEIFKKQEKRIKKVERRTSEESQP